jgi:hypothetical protein
MQQTGKTNEEALHGISRQASPSGLCTLDMQPPRKARKPVREAGPSSDLPTAASRPELLTASANRATLHLAHSGKCSPRRLNGSLE